MKKQIRNGILSSLVLISIGVFATTLHNAVIASSSEDVTGATSTPHASLSTLAASSTLPVGLAIPSIGINARVQHVGISKRGTIAVPTNYTDVGWFKASVMPGRKGTAIIDGHVDNGFGLPAVFRDLESVALGDEIIVTDTAGNRIRFKVTEKKVLEYDTASTDFLFQDTDAARLALVTCAGKWLPELEMYDRRLIVVAELAP